MTSHTKLPSGNYQVISRYIDPMTGERKKATLVYKNNTAKDREVAEQELLKKIQRIIKKKSFLNDYKIESFGELTEAWLASWQATVSTTTFKREKLVLSRIMENIHKDTPIQKMTPLYIEQLLTKYQLNHEASYATMRHIKSTLNKVFKYAVKQGSLVTSPMTFVEITMTREKRMAPMVRRAKKYLESHELRAFLTELYEHHSEIYYYLTLFLIYSGVRIGEASTLTERDIFFDKNSVSITKCLVQEAGQFRYTAPKSLHAIRTILLPPVAMDAIKNALQISKELDEENLKHPGKKFVASDAVFRTRFGSPISSHSFGKIVRQVQSQLVMNGKEKYGFNWMKQATPSSFRFSIISYLKDVKEIDANSLQYFAGHADIRTTLGIYAQETNSGKETILNEMIRWDEGGNEMNFRLN
ncbi:tyrosine-type recombinase/integrase [Enterococcus sp. HY326]|uniref:tyrosine-type recombinase/integrase n=1 Tax=Enterococcus sp. HY326 TaxID=2971265 RepID=UPI00223EFB65|nr:tyrosine-type recombinase/integrase [Enterococcus sp. HY326]